MLSVLVVADIFIEPPKQSLNGSMELQEPTVQEAVAVGNAIIATVGGFIKIEFLCHNQFS